MNPTVSLVTEVEVVSKVASMHNATVVGDVTTVVGVAAVNVVMVVDGDMDAVDVWVQRCLMRLCTIPQLSFVLVVVTPTGKELSWWDR